MLNNLPIPINELLPVWLILSTAIWRISFGLVRERGFMGVFHRIKTLFGYQYDDEGTEISMPIISYDTKFFTWIRYEFAYMLDCVLCTSLFLALLISVPLWFFPTATIYIAFCVSLGAISIILTKYFDS